MKAEGRSRQKEADARRERREDTDREQREDPDKQEYETTGEQAVRITNEQEENGTREQEGDQEQGENTAGELEKNRRGGEWKKEAIKEGAGGDHGRTSPTEEQRGSKSQDPEPSHVPEATWLSQVRARLQGSASSIIRRGKRRWGEEEKSKGVYPHIAEAGE
ncbi:hypothetical protein NDU88_006955 [Pleurodeles waltl]|uniref:Uncharacterized protein n=1 Tax=Pleurodeles waltl TaxID=8319 RepID=A0AAV7RNY4_PLEWA|nr:hypothetical protein NDU88_006955 [Pleurodeles waltl]